MTRFLTLLLATTFAAPALAWDDPDCMRDYEQEVQAIRAEYAMWAAETEQEFRNFVAQYQGQLDPQLRQALRQELEASLASIRAQRDADLAAFEEQVCPGECEDLDGDGVCDDECYDAQGTWVCECEDLDGDGACDACYDADGDEVMCQLP